MIRTGPSQGVEPPEEARMRRKPVRVCLVGCGTLSIFLIVLCVAGASWVYLAIPVEAGQGHDGSSAGTAIIVEATNEFDAINAEYAWLMTRRPNDSLLLQSLVFDGDRVYDVFEMQTSDGETYTLYFDKTKAYGIW
jgi:hypothetical protein